MQFFAPLSLLASVAFAAPALEAEKRQSATTCGSTSYTAARVQAAANNACNYVRQGDTAGGSTYPHQYNNYEGFKFKSSGPWEEFPILASGQAYTGGSPGPDRVIINTSCQFAGVITHTGASGNNFVGCSGTST